MQLWNHFKGRRGGFSATDVITHINSMRSNPLSMDENIDLRNLLLAEFRGRAQTPFGRIRLHSQAPQASDSRPSRLRSQAPQAREPRPLSRFDPRAIAPTAFGTPPQQAAAARESRPNAPAAAVDTDESDAEWVERRRRSRSVPVSQVSPLAISRMRTEDEPDSVWVTYRRDRALSPTLSSDSSSQEDDDMELVIESIQQRRAHESDDDACAHKSLFIPATPNTLQIVSEDHYDSDLARAIELSLLPAMRPRPIATPCLLCHDDDNAAFRISHCCEHVYCRDCIANMILSSGTLPRCPDCVRDGYQPPALQSMPGFGVPLPARMSLDPYFVNKVDPTLCHGRHLAPFLAVQPFSGFPMPCPLCETVVYGTTDMVYQESCRYPLALRPFFCG